VTHCTNEGEIWHVGVVEIFEYKHPTWTYPFRDKFQRLCTVLWLVNF